MLNGAWCVVDGLKIPIQKSGDEEIQNAVSRLCLFQEAMSIFIKSGKAKLGGLFAHDLRVA